MLSTHYILGRPVPIPAEALDATCVRDSAAEQKSRDSRARSVTGFRAEKKPNGCTIWLGPFDKDGCPVRILHGNQVNVRSLLFRIYNPGNEGKDVFNACGDLRCIAPEHSSLKRRVKTIPEKLAKHQITVTNCHVFPSQKNKGGKIPKFRHNRRTLNAKREAYRLKYQAIPKGWSIKNTCDNQACFNPEHLRAVPPAAQRLFPEARKKNAIRIYSDEAVVKTLAERLMESCVRKESGCLEWIGTFRKSNLTPLAKIDGDQIYPRPALYNIRFPLNPAKRVYGNTCGNPKCVEPDHTLRFKPATALLTLLNNRKVFGPHDCHVSKNHNGRNEYLQISHGGKKEGAHRVIYELHHGLIPNGMQIHHICNHKACFRIDHLRLVTAKENIAAAIADGRFNVPRTKGATHKNTTLQDPDVIRIRELFRQNVSVSKMAEYYGKTGSHMRHIGKFMARTDANLIHYEINKGRTMAPLDLLLNSRNENEHFMVIEGYKGATFYAKTDADAKWISADWSAWSYIKKILRINEPNQIV